MHAKKAGGHPSRNAPQAPGERAAQRRRYDSPVRRQQIAETRARIVAAGAELVHGFPAWDWTNLTAAAVGARAGVSERTVHRYFSTERKLRDAVVQRLVEESGVTLEGLKLEEFAALAARLFAYLSSFAVAPTTVDDPTLASIDQRRRDALLGAVARATPAWSERERQTVAAVLDILWNPPSYERLITAWNLDPARAIGALTWLIGLVEEAVGKGRRPLGGC
jgi:AcrR family transcriptional regulator